MARPRKWENDAQRRQAQNDSRKSLRQAHEVKFIGIDGEGTGRWRQHKYVLLGIGDSQVENGNGLEFTEIFSHLYEQYRANPGAAFVGFFLGYDFTQWFKRLPEERARYLFTSAGIAKRQRKKAPQLGPFPVEYEGFEFDLLGMKRLKLRETGESGWMYVCDAGSFFQSSLLSVINPAGWDKPVVSEEEYDILESGKAKRDNAGLDSGMRAYNALENDVLARLMGRLNQGFTTAGVRLKKSQWFGPGQAAQAWMGQVKAPTGEMVRMAVSTNWEDGGNQAIQYAGFQGLQRRTEKVSVLDAGRASYYGGWFEIFAHGHIPGRTWEYDINSAYPHIISTLPCLNHGKWENDNSYDIRAGAKSSLYLVYASVEGSNPRIGAMLHRCEDHSIRRPYSTVGWYWGDELHAAWRCGLIDKIDVMQAIAYRPCDCPAPLRGIAGLYEERLRVGKNTPAGKAYKLMYNSAYGKFAQSVGNPKYGNAFYASRITSGCRTMILDAITTHPEGTNAVVMVATDGVYFTGRHTGLHTGLHIGNALGEWEESSHDNLTLFKPGIYWDDKTRQKISEGKDPSFKARGINAKDFAGQLAEIDAHFSRWPEHYPAERDPETTREGWYPKVEFKSGFSMVTCQQALQRGKWFLAGSVGSTKLVQDADPISKRHSGYLDRETGIYWSRPFKDGGPRRESCPYDKRFGQPDPSEFGINDDGYVKDQWAALVR